MVQAEPLSVVNHQMSKCEAEVQSEMPRGPSHGRKPYRSGGAMSESNKERNESTFPTPTKSPRLAASHSDMHTGQPQHVLSASRNGQQGNSSLHQNPRAFGAYSSGERRGFARSEGSFATNQYRNQHFNNNTNFDSGKPRSYEQPTASATIRPRALRHSTSDHQSNSTAFKTMPSSQPPAHGRYSTDSTNSNRPEYWRSNYDQQGSLGSESHLYPRNHRKYQQQVQARPLTSLLSSQFPSRLLAQHSTENDCAESRRQLAQYHQIDTSQLRPLSESYNIGIGIVISIFLIDAK